MNAKETAQGCGCLLLLGLLAIAGVRSLFGDDKAAEASAAPTPSATPVAATTEPKKPKPACVLGHAKSDTVPVFPTKEGLDEFFRVPAEHIAATLVRTGAFQVKNGTLCVSLDTGFATSKIRVLEGQHDGRIGWVATDWRTAERAE